jgi:hypothetical protein
MSMLAFFRPVHERAVGHAELAHGGVDAGDPQRAELALALAAVAVGVLPRLHHRLLGDAVDVLAAAAETLGLLEDLLVARACGYAAFDSGHGALLRRTAAWREPLVVVVHLGRAAQLALALGGLLGEDVAQERLRALDAAAPRTLKRFAALFFVFILGMTASSSFA